MTAVLALVLGPLAEELSKISPPNIRWVGHVTGEAKRELVAGCRAILFPALWAEPVFPESSCTDWAGLTSVIRHNGRERTATHVCGATGLTGQVARIVMDGRITDWGAVPSANLPGGITIQRFPDRYEQYFRYSSALTDPANFVITQPAEWDAIWRRIVARHGNPPAPPPVDFSREMLLVAAMGTQPTGGYAIRIDRVIDNETFLEVLVTRTSPGPRCGATAALTNPVDVVRVPASMKPVRWAVGDVQTVCP